MHYWNVLYCPLCIAIYDIQVMKHAKKSKSLLSKSNLSEIVLFSPDLVVSYGPLVDLRSTYKPGQGAVHGTISDQLTTIFPLADANIYQSK